MSDWFHRVFVLNLDVWVVFGFLAQLLFTMRFLVQWVASERAGRSVVPVTFWLFSFAGGVLLFVYAVVRQDPVFIAGQGLGLFVYSRNMVLIMRERRVLAAANS